VATPGQDTIRLLRCAHGRAERYRDHVSARSSPSRSNALGASDFATAIDRDAEVPVGLQLGWALGARIGSGELAPGQRLPGLRELAEASGLNVNTVRSVYQRLEQQGLLESLQGSGTFVAATLPHPSAAGVIAADAAREAAAIGISPREVAAALYVAAPAEERVREERVREERGGQAVRAGGTTGAGAGVPAHEDEWDTADEHGAADEQGAARRRALRAQIATLERAIGEIEAEHPGVAPRPAATRRGPGPVLLNAQELEQVRSGLVRRLAAVQAAVDERASEQRAGSERAEQQHAVQKSAPARVRTRARKRLAGLAAEDEPPADSDSPGGSAPVSKRPAKPRSTPRPAAAGT
jgi:DNA-binding transcriptional regulator YhcF (GntR family)